MKNKTFLFFISIWLLSCNPTEVAVVENQFLKGSELIKTYGQEEFKNQIAGTFGDISSQALLFVQSGIEQYKIIYETKDTEGNKILASGAVMLPTSFTKNLAIGSLHHGTLFDEQDAPSYFNFQSESTLATFLASTGIIIGMPDYVGYGESKNLPHPYEHYQGLGEPGADFIRAMVEFIKEKDLEWNGTLMLSGYSEGGYAAMSTHKWIQDNPAGELKVTVSVCGAGAYNKTATFKKLINETGSSEISNNRSYIWVLQTYNRIYGLNKPMSYFFKEPYATAVDNNGIRTEINVSLDKTLTDQFKKDFNNGTLQAFNQAVAANDIFDWRPDAIMRLYHGKNDQYVPFLNSETAFDAMKNRGVSDIELIAIEDGTHGSTISDYFFGVLQLFTVHKLDGTAQ